MPKTPVTKTEQFNLKLTKQMMDDLNTYCEEQGIAKTRVIETAINRLIYNNEFNEILSEVSNER